MPLLVSWLPHGQVVREGHETDPRRSYPMLHGQRDGGDSVLFYGVANQPDGPVAKGSGGREQHRVDAVFDEFSGNLWGRRFDERGRVVDGAHEGEVARSERADQVIFY